MPRIPESKSTTDFVVIAFVIIIGFMLLAFTVATIIAGIQGHDVKAYVATLTDIITTIIGALIGFIAGKGQGQAEVRREYEITGEVPVQSNEIPVVAHTQTEEHHET